MRLVFANSWNRSLSWFFYAQGMSTPPLGMCRAAAFIVGHGHEARVIDGQALRLDADALAERILEEHPDAVVVGAFPELHLHVFMGVSALPYDLALLGAIRRRNPECRLFLGGYLPERFPERTLSLAPEGTRIAHDFGDLLAEAPPREAPHQDLAAGTTAMAGYPFLEPDIRTYGVDAGFFLDESARTCRPVLPILTAWGCPHRCTFCATPVRFRNRVTQRDVVAVVDEIEAGVLRYGTRSLSVWDDTFTTSVARVEAFASEIVRRGLDIRWWCFGQAQWVNRNRHLLSALREAGCRMMWIGVESTEADRLAAYGKGIGVQDGPAAVEALVAADILPTTSFILGEPEDGRAGVEARVRQAKSFEDMGAVVVQTLSIPVPGTDRFRQMAAQDRILRQDLRLFSGVRSVVDVPGMSPDEVETVFRDAYLDAILSPRWMNAFGRANLWETAGAEQDANGSAPASLQELRESARREFARLQAVERGSEPLVEARWFLS